MDSVDGATSARLSRCASLWGLRIKRPLDGGFLPRVFACVDAHSNRLAVKLSPPEAVPALEAAALRVWNGIGAVRLREWSPDLRALLLDRVSPGTPLPAGDDENAIRVAAAILPLLHSVRVPPDQRFPMFPEAFASYMSRARAEAEPEAAGVPLLPRSHACARHLWSTAQEEVLLHGDFIDKNLLLGASGYTAIDPMPRIGDPCSDIGFIAAYHPPASGIRARARAIAERLNKDPDRAERWAAVWAVGEACETWRSDSDELQAWIRSREADALLTV